METFLAWCTSKNILQVDYSLHVSLIICQYLPPPQIISISPERRMRSDKRYIRLLTRGRIDVIVRLILTITTVSLLMLPSAVLYLLPEHQALKIILIMLFTLLFSSALTIFTKAYVAYSLPREFRIYLIKKWREDRAQIFLGRDTSNLPLLLGKCYLLPHCSNILKADLCVMGCNTSVFRFLLFYQYGGVQSLYYVYHSVRVSILPSVTRSFFPMFLLCSALTQTNRSILVP